MLSEHMLGKPAHNPMKGTHHAPLAKNQQRHDQTNVAGESEMPNQESQKALTKCRELLATLKQGLIKIPSIYRGQRKEKSCLK